VSSDLEQFPAVHSSWDGDTAGGGSLPCRTTSPSHKEWAVAALLFSLTAVTTTFAGLAYTEGLMGFTDLLRMLALNPERLLSALQFSVPLISILLAHEMGHFLACRHYGIRCTPPFFIPAPIPFSGTFGAFIRIKSPFTNRKSLFDVGFAGPLAGFVAALIVLWIGIDLSRVVPKVPIQAGYIYFGEPLIFRFLGRLLLDYNPAMNDMYVHPAAIAGLWGLLVTSLNLLPIWQLDGGHISYSVFGSRNQKRISVAVLLALAGFILFSEPSYLVFCLLVFILGYRSRFQHPATLRDGEPLGVARTLLAVAAGIILILCFTPVPIWFS
jgi:membrane-associated protease RseP (regulator of RpoE activity)